MSEPSISTGKVKQKSYRPFDLEKIRDDFPILKREVNGKPLVYFDNAATTQKPIQVINTISNYYLNENANVHRGLHFLSEMATDDYENARLKVKEFLNALSTSEIVFTRGTTESINLLVSAYARKNYFKEGDEVIISHMEHHSNIVPWQLLRDERNIKIRVIPITDKGEIIFEEFEKMINEKTKFVSIVHVSNTLGTINPIKKIVDKAHNFNIPVLIDGAQATAHQKIDVQDLGCDFYAFSGHKTFGPTGIGVLYGKAGLLDKLPPYQGGGEMIRDVTFEKTTYNDIPHKFEAGTPNIVGAIGLGAAIDYIRSFNINDIANHELELLKYGTEKLSEIPGLRIIGNAGNKSAVISFVIDGIHPYDIGTIIDTYGVAIRTGHHCTQPLIERYGLTATARASFALYNSLEEIDILTESLNKTINMFH